MYTNKLKILNSSFFFIVLIVVFLLYYFTHTAPRDFPVGKNFIVNEGESLISISKRLEEENYIKSSLLFRAWVSFLGRDRSVQLGEYVFEKPYLLGGVIKKLISLNPDKPLIKVTIPEGSTSYEIAVLIKKELPNISIDIFGERISKNESDGKLFPSTYFLLPS